MKNPYRKFIKYLEKQNNVYFQCSGDSVYLTDNVIVLKVPMMVYRTLIRPLSGILPDGQTDCKGMRSYGDSMIELSPHAIDIEQAVVKLNTKREVKITPFSIDVPTKGKPKKARIFVADNNIITVDETLIDVFSECQIATSWVGAGTENTPVIQKDDDSMIVIFPIKVNKENFRMWRDIKW